METNKILSMLVVIAVVVALANISVTFLKVAELKDRITGYAGESTGEVNITVTNVRSINFSTASINFGVGTIDGGQTNATVQTNGDSAATAARGNWSSQSGWSVPGLVLQNIGNINSSLTLNTATNAGGLFGSGGSGQEDYEWNVSIKDTNSCSGGTETLNRWGDVNNSVAGKYCNQFGYLTSGNELYIDIRFSVAYDIKNATSLSDTITATAGTPS